jgi:branched-subunit amino acid ABC-type transport system permease component
VLELLLTALNGLARGLLLFTMAAGLSMLFGLMSVLNLAHGALLLIGGYVAVALAMNGDGFFGALPVAIVVGAVLGIGLFLAVKPITHRGHLQQGLLTLGFAFIFADIAKMLWGNNVYIPSPPEIFTGSAQIFGQAYPVYRLVIIFVGIVIAIGIFFVFERTRLGALVRAAVSDQEMVAALGFRVSLITGGVFAGAAALAAFGGLVGAPLLGVRPGLDIDMLILALVVIVIGGLGSLKGALVGAILIGQVQTLGIALLPDISSFLLFGVMALVLLLKPAGLFGGVARAA